MDGRQLWEETYGAGETETMADGMIVYRSIPAELE